jgi:hypothetical protein
MKMSTNNSKWILTVPREIHLGFIKETFGRGAVIELDMDNGRLIIDGRKFEDTRDLELLQRRGIKHPDSPWVVPFSDEAYQAIRSGGSVAVNDIPRAQKTQGENPLPIIQDDSDDHPVIDIRHTQISKHTEATKQAGRTAAHEREVGRKMEVIQGDETASERLERLKGKGDMRSMQERVAMKRQRVAMPVVHDDSLGMGVGKHEIPMNAGQHLPSREEADAKAEVTKAEAELRKQHLDMTRKRAGVTIPEPGAASEIDMDIPPELAAAVDVIGGTSTDEVMAETESAVSGTTVNQEDVDALEADFEMEAAKQAEAAPDETLVAENEALREENAVLKSTQETILERLAALERPAPVAKKAAKKPAKKAAKKATKVKRTPVTAEG